MNKEKIGERIREIRGDKTQKEYGKEIGVTAMAVSQYENGERVPTDEIKIKIAKMAGRSVESIFYAFE